MGLLTGKQIWRRQHQRHRNNHHDVFYREGLDVNLHFNQPNLAISQPTNTIGWATKAGDYSYKRSRRKNIVLLDLMSICGGVTLITKTSKNVQLKSSSAFF
eukprot:gene25644-33487_t